MGPCGSNTDIFWSKKNRQLLRQENPWEPPAHRHKQELGWTKELFQVAGTSLGRWMLPESTLSVHLSITAKFEQRMCDTDDPKYVSVGGEGVLLFH